VKQTDKEKRVRGCTIGYYFPGLTKPEANAVRKRLNEIAFKLGYKAERGATAGEGAAGRLLLAIASGELKLLGGHVVTDLKHTIRATYVQKEEHKE